LQKVENNSKHFEISCKKLQKVAKSCKKLEKVENILKIVACCIKLKKVIIVEKLLNMAKS
jgi:hypothetical protein